MNDKITTITLIASHYYYYRVIDTTQHLGTLKPETDIHLPRPQNGIELGTTNPRQLSNR